MNKLARNGFGNKQTCYINLSPSVMLNIQFTRTQVA